MSNLDKRLTELKLLLQTLDLSMTLFSDVASEENKQRGKRLKADVERSIAELEKELAASGKSATDTVKDEKPTAEASHAHGETTRERGDLRNPEDIIAAITEVVGEMRDHHKGSTPVGFAFVLVHAEGGKSDRLIVHGAGGGDNEIVADVLMERGLKLKMDLSPQ